MHSKSLEIYIISWPRWHEQARAIEETLRSSHYKVTVIFNDADDDPRVVPFPGWIRTPCTHFFAKKLEKILALNNSDVVLLITADTKTDSWPVLVERCLRSFLSLKNLGVWSPLIDNAAYKKKFYIIRYNSPGVRSVFQTDSIVWAISEPVLGRLKTLNMDKNQFGWGIDRIAAMASHARGMLVLVDESIQVHHAPGTGYSTKEALQQSSEFLRQMTVREKVVYRSIRTFLKLKRIFSLRPRGGGSR